MNRQPVWRGLSRGRLTRPRGAEKEALANQPAAEETVDGLADVAEVEDLPQLY